MRHVRTVTITGADDSIEPHHLINLTAEYPFVEWGILLSKSSEGGTRFPTLEWMRVLRQLRQEHPELRLCGHLCGRWVRDIVAGNMTFPEERTPIADMFDRFQLNFHAYLHEIDVQRFAAPWMRDNEFIFQIDGVNGHLLNQARSLGVRCNPLFDTSGGAGRLPSEWPSYIEPYCGYAGGLSPGNLDEQMALITEASGGRPIWIDVETKVRSNDDQQFDLGLVWNFLKAASKYVEET